MWYVMLTAEAASLLVISCVLLFEPDNDIVMQRIWLSGNNRSMESAIDMMKHVAMAFTASQVLPFGSIAFAYIISSLANF